MPHPSRGSKTLRSLTGLCLLVLLAGCIGQGYPLTAPRNYARSGEPESALASLDRSPLADQKRNRLLYLMERGALLRLSKEYDLSNEAFEEADRLADELYTLSLSAEGLSFLVNEKVVPYAGEDYEYVYLNYYKLLNYLDLAEIDEALVECRRLDEKLNYLADAFSDGEPHRVAPPLRLLTGLTYEAAGDYNNAFVAYRKSLEGYRKRSGRDADLPPLLWERLFCTAERSGLLEDAHRIAEESGIVEPACPADASSLAVLVETSLLPLKREVYMMVPTDYGFPVKLAVPRFDTQSERIDLAVSLDDAETRPTLIEDVEEIAKKSLESKIVRVMARAVARAVAKQLAARQAENELGPLAGLTVQIAALLSEEADLRSWTLLPNGISLALLTVTKGDHNLRISGGKTVRTRDIRIEEAPLTIVTDRVF